MKKQILTLLFAAISSFMHAVVIKQDFNITLNQQPQTEQLMFNTWSTSLYQVDFFSNGALSFAGKNTNEFVSTLYVKSVGGGNFTPVKMYNNKSVKAGDNWKSTPVFVYSPPIGFTSDFPAQGNVYIGGRVVFKTSQDTFYLWMLVNLNEQGTSFTIVKAGFEDTPSGDIMTENEGQNQPTTGIKNVSNLLLKVYPNPVKENLQITVGSATNFYYALSNLNGQNALSGFGSNQTNISVANLPKGLYLLTVTANGAILNRKIIVE